MDAELSQYISEFDRRLSVLEHVVNGEKSGLVGNQPLFSISGPITADSYTGAYPYHFNGIVFEVGAFVLVPPSATLTVVVNYFSVAIGASVLTTVSIPNGEHFGKSTLPSDPSDPAMKRVVSGDVSYLTIDADGGSAAEELSVWLKVG